MRKNEIYKGYISVLNQSEILPGAKEFIQEMRSCGYKTAVGSASKNTHMILERLRIENLFDAVIDGNMVTKTKPDPEVFLLAAKALSLAAKECVVFEDSAAGIEAAVSAGMMAVGIGNQTVLNKAGLVVSCLKDLVHFSVTDIPKN